MNKRKQHPPRLTGFMICSRCGILKHVSKYYPAKLNKTGLQYHCKVCENKNYKERRNGRCHHVVVAPRFKPSKKYMHKLFNDLVKAAPSKDKKTMQELRDYALILENLGEVKITLENNLV